MSDNKVQKRVIFLQHSANFGGAPRSLLQIVREYEREFGPQTVLFLRKGPVMGLYQELASNVTHGHVLLPFHGSEVSGMNWKIALRNIVGLLGVPYAYFRFLRGWDVVYLNSSALCFYGLAVKMLAPRTRVICHIREPLLDGFWGGAIRAVLRRSVSHFIAISKNELDNLKLADVSAEVVYNYVNSNEYAPRKGQSLHRKDPRVGAQKFVAGYFARLDVKNGLKDFLDIARRFEADEELAFCIYGHTGYENREIHEMLANASKNVSVYPMVSDVAANLGDLDVLVVPFKAPHFSRSVVEAAMMGVPSVIYDIVSVNETVKDGETGCVVPLNDIDAMGDRIKMLKDDRFLRETMSAAAQTFAMESFSERNYTKIRNAINETADR